MRGLIVVLWRAGLRIHEALKLAETDLDDRSGSVLVRLGKGDRRPEVGMDLWAWSVLNAWSTDRVVLPPGPLFYVIDGPPAGPRGQTGRSAPRCASSPLGPGSAGASRLTSSVRRMRSSYCTKESLCR
jgi:integrase